MTSNTTTACAGEAEDLLFDSWFDPIEAGLRARVRGFIETMIEEELTSALSRPRYARHPDGAGGAGVMGHRHGHRTRRLTGTFGPTEIVVPRARLLGADGTRSEWKSSGLRAYQRRTLAADALIASIYLAGTNTRRVRRALAAVFAGGVGKDVVSRVWRKVKTDWDAWNSRSLAEEPIVRLNPRRHGGPGAARSQSDLDLAPRRHRRARRWPEAAAGRQEHGRRDDRGLAC